MPLVPVDKRLLSAMRRWHQYQHHGHRAVSYGDSYGFFPLLPLMAVPLAAGAAAAATVAGVGSAAYRMVSTGPNVPGAVQPGTGFLPAAPPLVKAGDPTQAPLPEAPGGDKKLPEWVLPVGLSVGALFLFGGLAVVLGKGRKKKAVIGG